MIRQTGTESNLRLYANGHDPVTPRHIVPLSKDRRIPWRVGIIRSNIPRFLEFGDKQGS
jgi:hypothetical protein